MTLKSSFELVGKFLTQTMFLWVILSTEAIIVWKHLPDYSHLKPNTLIESLSYEETMNLGKLPKSMDFTVS